MCILIFAFVKNKISNFIDPLNKLSWTTILWESWNFCNLKLLSDRTGNTREVARECWTFHLNVPNEMRNCAITPRFDRLIVLTLGRGRDVGRVVVDFAAGCATTARKTCRALLTLLKIERSARLSHATIRREKDNDAYFKHSNLLGALNRPCKCRAIIFHRIHVIFIAVRNFQINIWFLMSLFLAMRCQSLFHNRLKRNVM